MAASEMALAEYAVIKAEQAARIAERNGYVATTALAIGTVLLAAHTGSRAWLLLIPAVTFPFGWRYLTADQMVSAIGRYFREHPVLQMGWEHDHAADRHRASRKVIQFAADLVMFCVSAAAALTAFWLAPETPLTLVASAAEALATSVLAWQFTVYADLPGQLIRGDAE